MGDRRARKDEPGFWSFGPMTDLLLREFMQRQYGEENAAEEEEALRSKVDEDHWVLDLPELTVKESKYVFDNSFVSFENLQFGRFSFRGMNPAIEKLAANQKAASELEVLEAKEKEMEVSDEEMAARYSSLVGTVGKKFATKRSRTSPPSQEGGGKRPKFMKPADD